MKKTLSILILFTLFMVPAQGQILKTIGSTLLQGAGNAVVGSMTERLEKKAENTVTKVINKTFGEVPTDTLNTSAVTGMDALGKMIGDVSSKVASATEQAGTAGMAPLRDFSQQNAARKEHNLTLAYDDWD